VPLRLKPAEKFIGKNPRTLQKTAKMDDILDINCCLQQATVSGVIGSLIGNASSCVAAFKIYIWGARLRSESRAFGNVEVLYE